MHKCPICGNYMQWYITYIAGTPFIGWKCDCGYDTATERVIVTNTTFTDRKELNVLVH